MCRRVEYMYSTSCFQDKLSVQRSVDRLDCYMSTEGRYEMRDNLSIIYRLTDSIRELCEIRELDSGMP